MTKHSPLAKTLLALACLFRPGCLPAHAEVFTYQGLLVDSGGAANGTYDLRFILFDAAAAGNQIGNVLTNSQAAVSNGLFVAALDFGANVFNGATDWLEIAVRLSSSAGDFTTLSPRQAITPAPWALFASAANASGIQGVLPDASLSPNIPRLDSNAVFTGAVVFTNPASTFAGNGSGLTNLSGAALQPGTVNSNALDVPTQALLGVGPAAAANAANITAGVLNPDLLSGDIPAPPIAYGLWSSPPYGTNTSVFIWSSPPASNYLAQYYGGPNANHGGYLEQVNSLEREPYFVEWTTDSTNVIFGIKDDIAAWRLIIDNVREQLHGFAYFNGGNDSWVQYSFPQRKTRHLRLEGDFRLIGFACHTNEALLPTPRRQKTAIIIADSWCESFPCWGNWLPRQFPNVDFWVSGIGGTGYTNAPAAKINYGARIQRDLIQYHPDYAFIWGSFNDTSDAINPATHAPYSSNDIYTAAVNLYQAIQAGSPQTQIIVIGPEENKTPMASPWTVARGAVTNAMRTAGLTAFIDPQDGPWITGSSATGAAWGNASLYIGATAHPTSAGADYLGEIIAQQLAQLAPSLTQPKSDTVQFLSVLGGSAQPLGSQVGVNGAVLWSSNGNVYVAQSPNGIFVANTLLIPAVVLPNLPPAPIVSLIPGNLQITVSWPSVPSATSYNVKRSLVSGGPYSFLVNTPSTFYVDPGLPAGTNYYYVVSSINTSGEGPNSAEVSAAPNPFDPASVAALMLRHEADQFSIGPAATNGQPVYDWTNQAFADSTFDFVQYQNQNVPFWTNNPAVNKGEPWLSFPNSDSTLVLNQNGSINPPCTVFIFAQFVDNNAPLFTGASFPKHTLGADSVHPWFLLGDDQFGDQPAAYVSSWILHEATFNGANSSWYTNGVAVQTSMNAAPGPLDSGSLLLSYNGNQAYAQIAAILIYTNSVGVTDRASIRNWFRSKYGAY